MSKSNLRGITLGYVHTNPFSNESRAVLFRFKKRFRFRIVFARPHCNADHERSHVVASVCQFGYSWSSGLVPGRHRFQIASFSPSTLENSVFKKRRFQIAPLWKAFSNGSVFGDRFRRCSVEDNHIQSKTAPFSFENGLVWTGP